MNIFMVSNFRMVFLRLFVIFLLGGLFLMMHPSKVSACTCSVTYDSPSEGLEASDAVFAGRVVSLSNTDRDGFYSGAPTAAEFYVSTVWKGPVEPTIIVMTSSHETTCGYEFHLGYEYILLMRRSHSVGN